MGKDESYPMLLQDLKDQIHQVCLRSKFDVIPGIFGNFAEELIQILGQFCRWEPLILGMIFLLQYECIQAGTALDRKLSSYLLM